MSDLLVVTGPPGAGKSTVSALVVAAFDTAALVPGDAFFGFWQRGAILPWLPEAHEQNAVVLRAAAAASGTFAAGGCPVVYDGVLVPTSLPLFADAAGGQGLDVRTELHYVVLLPPLERCRRQVATRAGHGFTDLAAAAHMHAEFASADVEARHVLVDLPESPADVARSVLQRYGDGDLRYRPGAAMPS